MRGAFFSFAPPILDALTANSLPQPSKVMNVAGF
jgi:hypothetical protein